MIRMWVAVALFPIPATVVADVHVDDFEDGNSESGWAFIRGGDVIESTGGPRVLLPVIVGAGVGSHPADVGPSHRGDGVRGAAQSGR